MSRLRTVCFVALFAVVAAASNAHARWLLAHSGEDAICSTLAPHESYQVLPTDPFMPAKVWEGNVGSLGDGNPECPCDTTIVEMHGAKPISTQNPADRQATFLRSFFLAPGEITNDLYLTIWADDCAEVSVNGIAVATVSRAQGVRTNIPVPVADVHQGVNELRIHVTNTGNAQCGSPTSRGGVGDCMFVIYSLTLYQATPVAPRTWGSLKTIYR